MRNASAVTHLGVLPSSGGGSGWRVRHWGACGLGIESGSKLTLEGVGNGRRWGAKPVGHDAPRRAEAGVEGPYPAPGRGAEVDGGGPALLHAGPGEAGA